MKRSGPPQRKTPLSRGTKRMKAVSKTNSRPWENASARNAYKAANQYDEIEWFLAANRIYVVDIRDQLEVNHIFGGSPKYDLLTNWIVVNSGSHDLFHEHETTWRVVCLVTKIRKLEFRHSEFKTASNFYLPGWLDKVKPDIDDLVRPLWEELVVFADNLKDEK